MVYEIFHIIYIITKNDTCKFFHFITPECYLLLFKFFLVSSFIKKDFLDHSISIQNCILRSLSGKSFLDSFPVSTVIINSMNGSRTILHSKGDFPEVPYDHFKQIDLSPYAWIHFEGRNMDAVSSMMNHIKTWRNEPNISNSLPIPCISVELEKPKPGLLPLAKHADVVFIGKEFAKYNGWSDMEKAIKGMTSHANFGSVIVCTWGEVGSCAVLLEEGRTKIEYSEAHFCAEAKDTLGAGDTFLAGFVKACLSRKSLKEALQFASKLAGAKCGIKGFSGIRNIYLESEK
ncbi:hypothetical protein J437_LFUL019223 [Ladona fulva]|uniref:Carbohydrate kinase PfkB domain-containing protein n=1 Tax=Ladona fulva TaxID=123851 RepID=A0A8K0KB55_LADFU|nr:hypothetical protein J437_LFUL019223 [Ladona fulva]